MFAKNKKLKIIFFTLFVNMVIFFGLEWITGYLIKEDNIYGNVGMMNGKHPLMECDGDLAYQIRKQAMGKLTHMFPIVIKKQKNSAISGKPISTKLSFNDKRELFAVRMGILLLTVWDIVALILNK